MNRFIKISAAGLELPDDAAEWVAVKDTKLGVWWSVEETKSMKQPAAVKKAAAMKIAGFEDWRLPTVDELFALADRTKHNPAIDGTYFPDCKSEWYWTSTPAAFSPADCAWVVYFYSGDAFYFDRYSNGFVRAVRAGQ
jgi:hypothetical protein